MQVGLVLEGSAMRGIFTAGVLDVFPDERIPIDDRQRPPGLVRREFAVETKRARCVTTKIPERQTLYGLPQPVHHGQHRQQRFHSLSTAF